MVSTKVRADGRCFLASIDLGEDGKSAFRDAHSPLDKETVYGGHLLVESTVGQSPYVEYTAAEWARFRGEELEENIGDIRLIKF